MRWTLIIASLTACSAVDVPPAPASAPAGLTVHGPDQPLPSAAVAPSGDTSLWTLCEEQRPGREFCLSVQQVRTIRIINKRREAALEKRIIAAEERADKNAARVAASADDERTAKVMMVIVPLLSLFAGGALGFGLCYLLR